MPAAVRRRALPARALVPTLCCAALAAAPADAATDPTYAAVRAARPDGRTLATSNLTLEKDAYRFTFRSGALHFLAPVGGRTIGAVFVGQGSYQLAPASESERRHLALLAGEAGLEHWRDDFSRALFLFADDTFEALQVEHPIASGAPDAAARSAFDALFGWQRDLDKFGTNFHLRIARDLLNAPHSRSCAFLALVDGEKLSPALAAVDPLGADALGVGVDLGGEDVVLYSGAETRRGFWYLSHRNWELARNRPSPYKPPADARHYAIDTRVVNNTEIEGETTITFDVLADGLRLLPLQLMRKLRISDVQWRAGDPAAGADWRPAAWIQEGEKEDPDAAVVLPEPLPKGTLAAVRIRYAGQEVLYDIGEKNFVVTSRTSWYPNLATFTDLATYDLVFRVPPRSDVVATGELVANREEKGGVVSTWRSTVPLRVAGFNYGRFKKKERKDDQTGQAIEVFTTAGTPGYLRELQAALDDSGLGGEAGAIPQDLEDPSGFSGGAFVAPSVATISPSTLAESALDDAQNAGRIFRAYFGANSYGRMAITQQAEWSYGQSWPTLVFLPYWSFVHGGVRQQLGLQRVRQSDAEGLTYHEISHQWWGHEVGWASYRDQWLSEGFAQFSALLALQLTRGWKEADRVLDLERKDLFEAIAGNAVSNDAGPISMGWRLANFRTAGAYQHVVYGKGMFVLHMLRQAMRDPAQPNPDAPFIALMTDFVKSWSGKNPSTLDFQRAVEKHMVPNLNATGDGKLDWFFRQWVHGTAVPKLESDLRVAKDGDGWRLTGSIAQSEVSADFRTLVPVYVEFEGKKGVVTAQVAAVPIVGSSTREIDLRVNLPAAPKRALINAHDDVLTRR
jgi:hypothetical protein